MFAIIGLGNPDRQYEETRHNAGFWVVEELARRHSQTQGYKEKFGCFYQRISIGENPCLLVLPQKYMNLSGEASLPLLRYLDVDMDNLIVVFDEVALPPGFIRVGRGGSDGGHNGVSDIISHLDSREFYRIRVGVGHPRDSLAGEAAKKSIDISSWVLSRPRPQEKELLDDAVLQAADAAETLISRGLETAQQQFNRKNASDSKSLEGVVEKKR